MDLLNEINLKGKHAGCDKINVFNNFIRTFYHIFRS